MGGKCLRPVAMRLIAGSTCPYPSPHDSTNANFRCIDSTVNKCSPQHALARWRRIAITKNQHWTRKNKMEVWKTKNLLRKNNIGLRVDLMKLSKNENETKTHPNKARTTKQHWTQKKMESDNSKLNSEKTALNSAKNKMKPRNINIELRRNKLDSEKKTRTSTKSKIAFWKWSL